MIKTSMLYDCSISYLTKLFGECEYPWEILPKIKAYIQEIIPALPESFKEISDGVFVGENVRIYPTATIEPPVIIGTGTVIRPGAFLRGCVITGSDCVIGNSTELKNSILLDHVQIPHYNYVGDSVLGNFAHMGAGAICSNFKADGKNVVVHANGDYETGLRKLGAMLGDGTDVGCGCVLNPGTVIGKKTSVYPRTVLRGVYPENCIIKSAENIVKRR